MARAWRRRPHGGRSDGGGGESNDPAPFPPIAEVIGQLSGPGLARSVLGQAWWDRALAESGTNPNARRWLWNAIAVDARADWIATQR